MTFRELHSVEEMKACERLEEEVWGLAERDLVPASQLVASAHAGGLVAAAFDGERMAGFVYGFPSHTGIGVGHHSHMLAVLPGYRGRGTGRALKMFQRDWCLARGVYEMTWTFDPLQAKNARFNLEHLGAYAGEYRVNAYGVMNDALNRGLPSDRLLARWDLRRSYLGLAAHTLPLDLDTLPLALAAKTGGEPAEPELTLSQERLAVYTPDVTVLYRNAPHLALPWRLALREVLRHYFARGYLATRFFLQHYILSAIHAEDEDTPDQ
ncbi:MAG: GNAT family N-acetyltransferase [Deinococcota bacterium]|jgi:chorismate synthase|nr:GNAT family N-acetyltransferase [Deinococcota bacterium]